ncbi:hypothetical protein [Peribacillus frigoritolerans]|uniref:hypothetical protein n=1 Tax=Peribacillus frigoritolerans TaxID=450367 RepID=UPI00301B0CC3
METPKKTLDASVLTEDEKRDQMFKQVVQDLTENAEVIGKTILLLQRLNKIGILEALADLNTTGGKK